MTPGEAGAGEGTSRRVLETPEGAPARFSVEVEGAGTHDGVRSIAVRGSGPAGDVQRLSRRIEGPSHAAYLDLFGDLAAAFGLPAPLSRRAAPAAAADRRLRPLLTAPVSAGTAYGYGDPSVLRVDDGPNGPVWYLVVTSNDAPDAFPILSSEDLETWRPAGCVFPDGAQPAWTLTGENRADFWAPEMHRVGGEFWLCFAARGRDHQLAIGMARAASPEGPFEAAPEPLLQGGVIDPHILVDHEGAPHLLWKVDNNDRWPGLLSELLHAHPRLAGRLFPDPADQRLVSLVATLWPWVRTLEPMEQFFLQQPMIEATTADFAAARARVAALADDGSAVGRQAQALLDAFRTRIYAQRLAPDGMGLVGEPAAVIENDLPWEAHLIEGVWVVQEEGRYYLFYAGNDFSTPHYGIGAAVSDSPLGPYRKLDEPLIRSSRAWWGPGHPSVAPGPDGRRRMFLHAFFPGEAAYKAFRALLTCAVEFDGDRIRLGRA